MSASKGWQESNRRYLTAALGEIREALARTAGKVAEPASSSEELDLKAAADAVPGEPALEALSRAFGLSDFERRLLLLCAGVELDAGVAGLCATAQGDPRSRWATFGLALAALPGAHWSAVAPISPLRLWRLVEVEAEAGLTHGPLRIQERVLHYLAGLSFIDPALEGLVSPIATPRALPESHRQVCQRLVEIWRGRARRNQRTLIHLTGADRESRLAVAAAACDQLGLRLHTLRAEGLPSSRTELGPLARLWDREGVLLQSALLVETVDDPTKIAGTAAFLERIKGMLLTSGDAAPRLDGRSTLRFEVGRPSAEEQRELWRKALGGRAKELSTGIDEVVAQFSFSPHSIFAVADEQEAEIEESSSKGAREALWRSCRALSRPRLGGLARRIEPVATKRDIVLPDLQHELLDQVVSQVRQRLQVYEGWGFEALGDRGLGISALFTGPSGTGKTMAAEVLANELRLDLYHIDLSAVVSKYIGETEKNLRELFDAAEQGEAVLLFDEADALFGRRSEVKDSHDRYANIEVSYLLQRMEAYRGLAILTTNFESALDQAFLRRIRFVLRFPFPGPELRERIWAGIFPKETPTSGLEEAQLARLNLTGGNIRNIAMSAAFLAADEGSSVTMPHIARAARAEFTKIGRSLPESEVRGWR
jgi:hypothetical protein